MQPGPSEAFIKIDWNLPLGPEAQQILFARMRLDFERETIGIPMAKKKQYRKSDSELLNLRNLLSLFCQVRSFLEGQLGADTVKVLVNKIKTTNFLDDEWLALVVARPDRFSPGFLVSQTAASRADIDLRESSIHIECEDQRKKVVEARLNFLRAAIWQRQYENREDQRYSQEDCPEAAFKNLGTAQATGRKR